MLSSSMDLQNQNFSEVLSAKIAGCLRIIANTAGAKAVKLISYQNGNWQTLQQWPANDIATSLEVPFSFQNQPTAVLADEVDHSWLNIPLDAGVNGHVLLFGNDLQTTTIDVEAVVLLADMINMLQQKAGRFQLSEAHFAQIIHDIRNPLGASLNAAQVLVRLAHEDKVQRLSKIVNDATQRTHRMIEHLGDFVRSSFGEGLKCNAFSKHNLKAMLANVVKKFDASAIQITATTEADVWGDDRRLAQLFELLIENSVSHRNPDYGVEVTLADVEGGVQFKVRNKILVPISDANLIGSPFFRSVNSSGKKGLGLGLYISKKIAEVHGAKQTIVVSETDFEAGILFKTMA